jgi:beta-xylosidase
VKLFKAAAVSTVVGVVAAISPSAGAHPQPPPTTYTNPVSAPAVDTFADPSIIPGRDGSWYAYATRDPLRTGETVPHPVPILRSDDLAHWTYAGDVFTAASLPAWAAPGSGLWAPDIRYLAGRYVLYYTVTDTTANPGEDFAIGVATAPTPLGPWTDSGRPVVAPRPAPFGGFLATLDPAELTDAQGRRWLYYGSYFGGVFVVPLTADGLTTAGAPTQVTIDNRYEGAYVVRRNGWYYLFASAANCCAGPTTGYSVFAGRSRTPTGPFVDRGGCRC